MENNNNYYDAIIIGAGLGGLTSGCILSQSGKKVLVIEQHNKAGGFATNFKRKGFTFEAALHNMGSFFEYESFYKIMNELNVMDKFNFISFNEFQRIIFPEHDFVIEKGIDNFSSYLKEQFPDESTGINNIFNILKSIHEEFEEIDNSEVPISDLQEAFPMLPIKFPNLVKLVDKTLNDLLSENVKDNKLKGIISNSWWVCGLPPGELASILFAIVLYKYYEYSGGIIEGTSQVLSNAIAAEIINNNGTVLFNTEVIKINVESDKVNGVITEDKQIFYSPIVISNANSYDTMVNMIPEENGSTKGLKRYIKKIKKSELSLSGLQLYLGLDCDPKDLGMKNHSLCVFTSYDQEECYKYVIDGNYDKTVLCATNFTSFDKTLMSSGKGILNIFTLDHISNWDYLTKEEYKIKKNDVMNILLERMEKYIPGISEHITVSELATPITMQRFTKNPDGAIYGFSHNVQQSGINRLSNITPIDGLFLVGAYVYPGAGFSSVISSSYTIAKSIIQSGNKKPDEEYSSVLR